MKIIIAGAGAVGTHLAKLLSRERHDITLIDKDSDRLEGISSNFELLTLCGEPSSIAVLKEAEVSRADLFVGVTPDEAHNMTCCMLAAKLGAKKTVARVDNAEYVLPEHREFFKTVGIDSIIYPEMLAGREIIHNIRRSWVRQWLEIQGGALLMLGIKIRNGAELLNTPLKELCQPDSPYHIVAVKRSGETVIPHGDDVVLDGDVVYFMTTPPYVETVKQAAGKADYPEVRNIFIMGGGDTTVQALQMLPPSIHAKVIDTDIHRCEELGELVDNSRVMIFHGDGRDLDLLREEGITRAGAFAALTDNSEMNILACLAAKNLGVMKTLAMIENLDYVNMAESLDIGSIINKKTFTASHIYQMMLKADVTNMKTLTVANADVAEFQVKQGMKITKKPVRDLGLPPTVTLGGLVRDGQGYLVNGDTFIQPGDTVTAFCLQNTVQKLEKFFK